MVAVALAFGIAGVVAPMRFGEVPRRVLAVPVLGALLLGGLALDGQLSRIDGAVLLLGYAAAVGYLMCLSRQGVSIEASGEVAKEMCKAEHLGKAKSTRFLAISLVMVVAASELLVEAPPTSSSASGCLRPWSA